MAIPDRKPAFSNTGNDRLQSVQQTEMEKTTKLGKNTKDTVFGHSCSFPVPSSRSVQELTHCFPSETPKLDSILQSRTNIKPTTNGLKI